LAELQLASLIYCNQNWTCIEEINQVFWFKKTEISGYVQEHWKKDDFFGYQFLNGVNPMLIRRCSELPKKFPVTDDMVFPHGEGHLANEIK
ncbi:hypothetical protein LDENG_00017930, partial [Lucifuga dentata]